MKILTWREAHDRKLNKYFTGVPCRKGHKAYRYVSSGACSECISGYGQKRKLGANYQRLEFILHPEDAIHVRTYVNAVQFARTYSE